MKAHPDHPALSKLAAGPDEPTDICFCGHTHWITVRANGCPSCACLEYQSIRGWVNVLAASTSALLDVLNTARKK